MRPEKPHKEPLSEKAAELKNVVAGAGAVNVLEPAGNSSDVGDQFNFEADSRSESDVKMSAEPAEPQVQREKPQVEPEEPPMEPEELEPQFSPVESSSDSSSYSDTVSITSMSVNTDTESRANKESEPEPEAVEEPQVELKLQVSPAGSSDDSDSDIDSDYFDCDYFDCTDDSNDADSGARISGPSIEVATNDLSLEEGAGGSTDKSDKYGLGSVTVPAISGKIRRGEPVSVGPTSLSQLLLGKLKKGLSYFESVAAGRTNRLKLTAQG
jgi:hypothetical protein